MAILNNCEVISPLWSQQHHTRNQAHAFKLLDHFLPVDGSALFFGSAFVF